MIDPTTRLTAKIKLAELRRQRTQMREHYDQLERAAAQAGTPRERLRLLYEGLQQARFAGKPLHPEVANLEALLLEGELGTASPEMLGQWQERLRAELSQGRLRSEFAFIFANVLDEWMQMGDQVPAGESTQPHPFEGTLELLWSPPAESPDLDLLRRLFDKHRETFDKVRQAVTEFADKEAQAAVPAELAQGLLRLIGNDITRAADLRRQALTAATDPLGVNELAGALTVLVNNLDDWNWPAEGFPLRPLFSRTKWRPYLEEDLLTQLFQQLVGLRWGVVLKKAFQEHVHQHTSGPFGVSRAESQWNPHRQQRINQINKTFLPMIPISLEKLHERREYGGYESRSLTPDSLDAFHELLLLVNADVRLAQAAAPDAPLWVVQTDLRDYYLRVSHPVLLCLLENLGFPQRWLAFFRKFLAVPVRYRGELRTIRRGVMLDHVLSDVLAEYLLLLLDIHVYDAAQVRLLRVVDDIFFVTDTRGKAVKAWQAVRSFCQAVGLATNERKSGSVCLSPAGSEKPGGTAPELPAGLPRWGMLQLNAKGEWELHQESWQEFQAVMRRRLSRPMPVLTLISLYNSSLQYVLKFLGMQAPLGVTHRAQIAAALARMHNGLFGDNHGLLHEVRRRWESLAAGSTEQRIPEALFYWPLTAGGLGLFNPVVAVAAFHLAALAWKPPPLPEADPSQPFDIRWYAYFGSWMQPVKPATPVATPALEALMDDFASRSGEVAGRTDKRPTRKGKKPAKKRTNLSVYWQWVIYTYGPQLLATLGTFRFLVTELVPLQLIVRNRIDASSLSEETGSGLLEETEGDVLPI